MTAQQIIESISGKALLGEVVAWNVSGTTITHTQLVEALRAADLDEGLAREFMPKNAFARACRKLSDNRVIRRLHEDSASIVFQFTRENLDTVEDRFQYDLESKLLLNKKTGEITCEVPELAALAKAEFDRCMAERTATDVTRIIQKVFDRNADLFPIREQGGAYFVPKGFSYIVDRVETFLGKINGRIVRFPVPAGTESGDRSVKESVKAGIEAMIEEHFEAIASFGESTREDTLQKAAERIMVTKHKLSAYAEYLGSEREKLEAALELANEKLKAKVESLAAPEEETVGAR